MKFHFAHPKKAIAGAAILLMALQANAQSKDYLKAADNYYNKADYYSAAQYYEMYLTGKKTDKASTFDPYTQNVIVTRAKTEVSTHPAVVYNLAESYRKLHYPGKAEPIYKQVMDGGDKSKFPLAKYWYAKTLRANGKYDEAGQALNEFLSEYPTDDNYKADARKELGNLDFIKKQMAKSQAELALYAISKAPVTAEGATYAPAIKGDSLYYTSTKSDSNAAAKKKHLNKVFRSTVEGGSAATADKVFAGQPDNRHYGATTFTPDGNTMYLTIWPVETDKKIATIYKSQKGTAGSWTEPQPVAALNKEGYSSQQPCVTKDGKYLVFASNMPGGQGKLDLWYATLDASGNIGAPVNLGTSINTAEDEVAPYYHASSGSLVFASNGRVGMGGYDLYVSKGDFMTWSAPENMGYPVNSEKDEMYFATTNTNRKKLVEHVFISSDRESACCLELFTLNKARPAKTVTGKIVDCETKQPLGGAIVNISGQGTQQTTADGSYSFVMPDYKESTANVTAKGYESGSLSFYQPKDGDEEDSLVNPVICLVKIKNPPYEEEKLNTLFTFFDFDKAILKDSSFLVLDSVVTVMKRFPKMEIIISAHTDNKGTDEYNVDLSKARAKACKDYLVSKGVDADRIQTIGYGEAQPIAPNEIDGKDNPAGRARNRRTELKVLHY
jgi:OOP family OmpA-OmpF porin